MKICIIGKGVSGWMAASFLTKTLEFIDEITIIGSPEIKTIGVGESNTLLLKVFHDIIGISLADFVEHSDAAVKYGVYYKNWGGEDFLHHFKSNEGWNSDHEVQFYYKSLRNKPDDVSINDIIAPDLNKFVKNNMVSLNETYYPKSWHFDAAKYISYLEKFNSKNKKIKSYQDTVVSCNFSADETIEKLLLKSGREVKADYFVFASGSSELLENILGEKYHDLSDVLLTNRAIVYPLKYTDKKNQFHPYTVAKTMNCGWRWITPTYIRIGTGYVYSTNHISDDEAINEFLSDIGDFTITPNVVNFSPRFNKKTFKNNYCTIGMSNGFLEPLDAPGITLTLQAIHSLSSILYLLRYESKNVSEINFLRHYSNYYMESSYKRWAAFILHQYKTSSSKNNSFWSDHRNVKWDFYDEILNSIKHSDDDSRGEYAIMMHHTTAAKNKKWENSIQYIPSKQKVIDQPLIHHLNYVDNIRKRKNFDINIFSK